MAVQHQLVKYYRLGGLELKSSAVEADPNRSSDMTNFTRLDAAVDTSREGFQRRTDSSVQNGGYGTILYRKVDDTTGAVSLERLMVGSKLYRVKEGSLALTYTGSGASIFVSMLFDETDSAWHFKITEDGVEVLDETLSVGYDEASISTIDDLRATIDALTDFGATLTGSTSTPAAFLPTTENTAFASGALALSYEYVEEVNHPTSATAAFNGLHGQRNAAQFENASHVEMQNVVYIATGYDELKKYDGVDCYRAGLPLPTIDSISGTSGSVPAGTYRHVVTLEQKDAQGNIFESMVSAEEPTTLGAPGGFSLTVDSVSSNSGFNTDCAIVAGAQSTVNTITVDDGSGGNHTMKVGQTAFFYDEVSADFVEREITSVAATTITVDGAAVTVTDNRVISNNLKFNVYRSLVGGFTYFFSGIGDANNSFASTQSFTDVVLDANLGGALLDPALVGAEAGLPLKGKYIEVFRGRLLVSGAPSQPKTVYFSDSASPEAFPAANSFQIAGPLNSPISALLAGNEFTWILTDDQAFILVGNLVAGQFRVDLVASEIGCSAHATALDIDGTQYWYGKDGYYATSGGSIPAKISDDINTIFTSGKTIDGDVFTSKRAVATYDPTIEKILLYLPVETTIGGNLHPTTDSRVMVYDRRDREWFQWKGLNLAGGVVEADGKLYWTERRYSSFDSNMAYHHIAQLRANSIYDYIDHDVKIDWEYDGHWEDLGEPSIAKKFLRWKGFVVEPTFQANFTLTVKTERNYLKDVSHSSFDVTFGGSSALGWGSGAWGSFPWGHPSSDVTKRVKLKAGKAYSHRVRYSAGAIYTRPVLSAYELEIAPTHKPHQRG